MLRPENRPCCPVPEHPPLPDIRAGLSTLPRQLVGFPEYRRAMLAAVSQPAPLFGTADATPLAGWTADGAHDLGVMLIEAWAYVLDIAGFYDGVVADLAYLGTARDDQAMREIVSLIGYVPRPAMVSRVTVAFEAKGEDKVVAPAGTGVRSQASDDVPAQVFELLAPADVWPQRNRWTLAPLRLDSFDGVVRFPPGAAPSVGAILALTDPAGAVAAFGRVAAVDSVTEADGLKYQKVSFEDGAVVAAAGSLPLSGLRADILALRCGLTPLIDRDDAAGPDNTAGRQFAVLDSLYPAIAKGSPAAVEVDGALHPTVIRRVSVKTVEQGTGVKDTADNEIAVDLRFTRIEFDAVDADIEDGSVFVHVLPRRIGRPTRPAETAIALDLIRDDGALERPVRPLGDAPAAGDAVAVGAAVKGAFLPGTVMIAADGSARFLPDAAAADFVAPLVTPVRIHGNLAEAVRGETVAHEVVGSADASIAGQRFALRKKPLSWIEDASKGLGRAPQLTVRVDGLEWAYVESLYGRGPDERVYRVEMALDGAATIVFGDGVRGARPASGTANVTAGYRFGAGAARPAAGAIAQFSKPARDLSGVVGPLAASGGADAETFAEIGSAAPASTLSIGRAVSLADFEAMARSFSGVANAAVAYSWDPVRHEAVVTVWTIGDGGDPTGALAGYLDARSVPGLPIRVTAASPVDVPVFDVTIEAAEGYDPAAVRAAVRAALFDPVVGLLCPRRIAIAAPLFRSQLLAAIHAVPGVGSVPSIMLEGGEMAKAMLVGEGEWLDLLAHGQVL